MNSRPMYHPVRVEKFHQSGEGIAFWWCLSAIILIIGTILVISGIWQVAFAFLVPGSLVHYYIRAFNHEAYELGETGVKIRIYDAYNSLSAESKKKIPLSVESISKLTEDEEWDVYRALNSVEDAEKKRASLEAKLNARGKEIVRSINEAQEDVVHQNESFLETIKTMEKAELL